jgi:UDP-glucose 4-epimerase
MSRPLRYCITGGAGFVGINLTNRILADAGTAVTVIDNFSVGRRRDLDVHRGNPRFRVIEADLRDQAPLADAIGGHDIVYHLASNADISRAVTDPEFDFANGTVLTSNVLEAMRKSGVGRIVFVSGSGVYGEVPPTPIPETYSPMIPVSTYGACKLASEALVSAYAAMFDMQGTVFRLANVVGPRQTHGVAYDFIHRLRQDGSRLRILGDGLQSKPYVHVEDVIDAMMLIQDRNSSGYDCFNVGSTDALTVRDIADIVVSAMHLTAVEYEFTGGARGWKGDIPFYRLDTQKIRRLGWANRRSSRQAVEDSVAAMVGEADAN